MSGSVSAVGMGWQSALCHRVGDLQDAPGIDETVLSSIGLVLPRERGGVRTECAVELLAEDVSVPEVPVRLGHDMDHDVEQLDGWSGPPRHISRRLDRQRLDGRVCVLACPLVCGDDVRAGLALGDPHMIAIVKARVIESRGLLRVGTVEDRPEVPGLAQGQVLDQAEQVGARSSQWASDVVLL
jgi:hypothetical protein